jgi:hypothetical protein
MSVIADIVDTGFKFSGPHEVTGVQYLGGRLNINLRALDSSTGIAVTFEEIAGFRVLDEGDLLEFWPACNNKENWIFQIRSGGWFEQEARRPGFIRGDARAIREFMITGSDDCVSVLAWEAPKVSTDAV